MSEIGGDFLTTTEEKTPKANWKRNVSGELDVFEATRYFSDYLNEPTKIEYSRIQIQKQILVTELRQTRVHPESKVVVKPREGKEMTRGGGGGKLTSFLNSLLRSAGLKKSKLKSTPEVDTPRGERKRRNSCVVTTNAADSSPLSDAVTSRRRSFDEKQLKDFKNTDQKLNMQFHESLCPNQKVEFKDQKAKTNDEVKDGYKSDSSSESDLFELDLFAKSIP